MAACFDVFLVACLGGVMPFRPLDRPNKLWLAQGSRRWGATKRDLGEVLMAARRSASLSSGLLSSDNALSPANCVFPTLTSHDVFTQRRFVGCCRPKTRRLAIPVAGEPWSTAGYLGVQAALRRQSLVIDVKGELRY